MYAMKSKNTIHIKKVNLYIFLTYRVQVYYK